MRIPGWLRITAALTAGVGISLAGAFLDGEWDRVLGGLAVLATAVFAAWIGYRIGFANAQALHAYREELQREPDHKGLGPKDFAMDLRVDPAELLYDLTVGYHGWDTPTLYGPLTQAELRLKLAEHDVDLPGNAIRGHTRADAGLQLTWQPSTTDTTGETR